MWGGDTGGGVEWCPHIGVVSISRFRIYTIGELDIYCVNNWAKRRGSWQLTENWIVQEEEVVGGRHRRRSRVVAASPAVGRPPPNPTELRSRDLSCDFAPDICEQQQQAAWWQGVPEFDTLAPLGLNQYLNSIQFWTNSTHSTFFPTKKRTNWQVNLAFY